MVLWPRGRFDPLLRSAALVLTVATSACAVTMAVVGVWQILTAVLWPPSDEGGWGSLILLIMGGESLVAAVVAAGVAMLAAMLRRRGRPGWSTLVAALGTCAAVPVAFGLVNFAVHII